MRFYNNSKIDFMQGVILQNRRSVLILQRPEKFYHIQVVLVCFS